MQRAESCGNTLFSVARSPYAITTYIDFGFISELFPAMRNRIPRLRDVGMLLQTQWSLLQL